MRYESIAYYPIGDPRQDLPRTVQDPSVDSPGQLRTTTLTYSPTGLLTEKDETGYVRGVPITHTWKSTYDTRGRMLSSTLPRTDVNATSTMTYFADTDSDLMRAGQPLAVFDALSHSVSILSNGSGQTYNAFGTPFVIRDENGVITTRAFDGRGRLLSTTLGGVSGDAMNLVDQYSYDIAGRQVKHMEPLGNGQAFGFDSADRLTTETTLDVSGNQYDQMLTGYDSADEVVSQTAQGCTSPSPSCSNWQATTGIGYTYDTFGEMSGVTDAAVQQSGTNESANSEIVYTNQGQPAAAFDENHQDDASACGYAPPSDSLTSILGTTCVTNYGWTYDLAGRATSSIRALSSLLSSSYLTTSYAYDLSDDIITLTDPNGNVTSYHYDDFGNLLGENSPVSGVATYTYDADDNLASIRDATGAATQLTYDALDRPLSSVSTKPGASEEDVSWTYDNSGSGSFGIGRLSTMSDPTGTTSYTYDRRGLVTLESRNVGGYAMAQRYSYDGNGDRQSMTYSDGMTLAFAYDYANRPYSVSETASGTRAGTSATLPSGLIRKRTQVRGRLAQSAIAATHTVMGSSFSRNVGVNRPIFRRYSTLLNKRVAAAMRPLERIDAEAARALEVLSRVKASPASNKVRAFSRYVVLSGSPIVSSTTYAPFGPMTSQTFGNGTVRTIGLDARYRPAENVLKTATGTQLADVTYSEDAVGNVSTIEDNLDFRYDKSFTYDDMNRLTSSVTGLNGGNLTTSGVGLWGVALYQYDAMSNMTKQIVGARTDEFKYSGTTPLLTKVNSTSTVGGNITYDQAGNEAGVGQDQYTYSSRNKLASAFGPPYNDVTVPSVAVGGIVTPPIKSGSPWTYNYDGFGRRLTTTINSVSPGLTSVAGQKHISLFGTATRISLPDLNGNLATETSTSAPGTSEYDYVWLGNRPVAQIDSNGTHFTFTDHLDAPTIQTDISGAITYQADYEPFGSVFALRGTNNPHQPIRLPGQIAEQFDAGANGATDLSYNNARWYRPTWGRYSQADPLGLTFSVNAFAYANQNPLRVIDPSGLCQITILYHSIFQLGDLKETTSHGLLNVRENNQSFGSGKIYEGQPAHNPVLTLSGLDMGELQTFDVDRNNRDFISSLSAVANTMAARRGFVNVINDNLPCACWKRKLDKVTALIDAKHFKYAITGDDGYENSNGVLYELLKTLGGLDKVPGGKGAGANLPGFHSML